MILRFAAVFSRAIYLLGDMDKPFGVFDTLDYGWRSIIELMRMRAEFREKCYHVAKKIRESNNDNEDDDAKAIHNASVGLNIKEADINRNSWATVALEKK